MLGDSLGDVDSIHGGNSRVAAVQRQDFIVRTTTILPDPYAWIRSFLLITGAAGQHTFRYGRPRFSAWVSMPRRVLEKLYPEKVCVNFQVPKSGKKHKLKLSGPDIFRWGGGRPREGVGAK